MKIFYGENNLFVTFSKQPKIISFNGASFIFLSLKKKIELMGIKFI